MADLRPGDPVTCSSCGASTTATWSSQERAWQECWPVSLIWTHGPHSRWEVTHHRPELCIWCHERINSLGGVLGRRGHQQPGAGEGPLNAGQEDVRKEVRPRPGPVGNKAPLERPAASSNRPQLSLF